MIDTAVTGLNITVPASFDATSEKLADIAAAADNTAAAFHNITSERIDVAASAYIDASAPEIVDTVTDERIDVAASAFINASVPENVNAVAAENNNVAAAAFSDASTSEIVEAVTTVLACLNVTDNDVATQTFSDPITVDEAPEASAPTYALIDTSGIISYKKILMFTSSLSDTTGDITFHRTSKSSGRVAE